ncbi:hypothetical protein BD324DRAFT_620952 [Kockovaella imperatae]|uniref:Uncharacterized protein n=1 Tax=Kockovaella imperatae TaxID=4999 RepID=A0A1Y1UMV6_9TREE|nr:hypothetical protein BD324DRAFT_620952 [Kockovaella imperatae]ORX38465.1 hypothetical protein BD324DRAFT_620952 [Kockovaella imperatae]
MCGLNSEDIGRLTTYKMSLHHHLHRANKTSWLFICGDRIVREIVKKLPVELFPPPSTSTLPKVDHTVPADVSFYLASLPVDGQKNARLRSEVLRNPEGNAPPPPPRIYADHDLDVMLPEVLEALEDVMEPFTKEGFSQVLPRVRRMMDRLRDRVETGPRSRYSTQFFLDTIPLIFRAVASAEKLAGAIHPRMATYIDHLLTILSMSVLSTRPGVLSVAMAALSYDMVDKLAILSFDNNEAYHSPNVAYHIHYWLFMTVSALASAALVASIVGYHKPPAPLGPIMTKKQRRQASKEAMWSDCGYVCHVKGCAQKLQVEQDDTTIDPIYEAQAKNGTANRWYRAGDTFSKWVTKDENTGNKRVDFMACPDELHDFGESTNLRTGAMLLRQILHSKCRGGQGKPGVGGL